MKFRRRTNGGEHRVATRYAGKTRETYRVHGATIDFADDRFMFTGPPREPRGTALRCNEEQKKNKKK